MSDLDVTITFNDIDYEEWLKLNKAECIQTFAKECDIKEDEVEDWYGVEFDKYCRDWYGDDNIQELPALQELQESDLYPNNIRLVWMDKIRERLDEKQWSGEVYEFINEIYKYGLDEELRVNSKFGEKTI